MKPPSHDFSSCSSTRSRRAAVSRKLNHLPGRSSLANKSLCHHNVYKDSSLVSRQLSKPISRIFDRRSWTTLNCVLVALLLSVGCLAQPAHGSGMLSEDAMAMSGLLYDRSEPPKPPMRLHARQETTQASTIVPTETASEATSTSSGALATAEPTGETSLPVPFDSATGNNFTQSSCPIFFQEFLANATFRDCMPLSLLLQTSNDFFAAEKSFVRLTQVLHATCDVDFDTCSNLMDSLAQQIQLSSNCGQDLELENPTVLQAYNGLLAYQPLYRAGCLTDSNGDYCFANAVTNTSAPTSSYVYYLPLGVDLPAGTNPTCDNCLQSTMTIFASAASNNSVPLNGDYTSAAQQIDMSCGPQFVQASIEHTSAGTMATPSYVVALFVFGVVALISLA